MLSPDGHEILTVTLCRLPLCFPLSLWSRAVPPFFLLFVGTTFLHPPLRWCRALRLHFLSSAAIPVSLWVVQFVMCLDLVIELLVNVMELDCVCCLGRCRRDETTYSPARLVALFKKSVTIHTFQDSKSKFPCELEEICSIVFRVHSLHRLTFISFPLLYRPASYPNVFESAWSAAESESTSRRIETF